MIDLRSDTVTRPSNHMLKAMFAAPVGDDVFGEDPSVNALETETADVFGMEAGLFCPSGTMCNQIAIKVHTQPLDEVICHALSHIYNSETGAWAFHSGVSLRLVNGTDGIIRPADILKNINPRYDWQPRTTTVAIENTCNKAGGTYYTLSQLTEVSQVCRENNLRLHLDGARIFNALTASENSPRQIGGLIDSLSVCFSKGLGAPVGSVLVGSKAFIAEARRIRKAFGGGMRQAGFMAAGALFALKNYRLLLILDHCRAKILGRELKQQKYVKHLYPVLTNIILFDLQDGITAEQFIEAMKKQGILCIAFGPTQIRMVTHMDFDDDMLNYTMEVIPKLSFQ